MILVNQCIVGIFGVRYSSGLEESVFKIEVEK